MRMPVLLTSLLLLMCGSAVAAGTVAFNVKSYSTQQFPFVGEGYPVPGGVVIADFNRDGILDVAYSWPCCDASTSQREIIVKMGTGGGNLGPDITYGFGAGDPSSGVTNWPRSLRSTRGNIASRSSRMTSSAGAQPPLYRAVKRCSFAENPCQAI